MSLPSPSLSRPSRPRKAGAILLAAGLLASAGASRLAASAAAEAILPPLVPWAGKSRTLMAERNDPWVTPSEASGLAKTPSYEETVAYLERLVAAAPELSLVSLGKSPEGRDVWMVIASAERARTPEALAATGKPSLLAQGGIHSGEIDGKDAGLMLLRDMTVAGRERALLAKANLLFIPILNVDGHERASRYGRINQRGPEEMGWRTTARNLNLNRDYAKLDAPETRAVVAAIERYQPSLYFDLHVTDGSDYQYDITFGNNGPHGYSPAIARWLDSVLTPALNQDLAAWGHVPGPLINFIDANDPTKGNFFFTAPPRFSNGYGDLRHLPSVLVENHSLKPYDQRVLGTYVLLASALKTLGERSAELATAVAADRALRPARVPTGWRPPAGAPPATMELAAIEARQESSKVSGGKRTVWTGKPVTLTVPSVRASEATATVSRPKAYWVPPTYPEVIERLRTHGVEMEVAAAPRAVEVEMYRLQEPKLAAEPFEGRVNVTARPVAERRRETFPAGSVRISTDQPLGDLAVILLEPAAPDSFFQWGFFLEALQQTEYVEGYVMEPMAEAMLAESPALAKEFEGALAADPELAKSPGERLQWFYRRTPFFDERWRLYPVARELAP